MCHVFRLGSSLCALYNKLVPAFSSPLSPLHSDLPAPPPIRYEVPKIADCPEGVRNWSKRPENMKECQKYIAEFCMTMTGHRNEGRWPGEVCAFMEVWGRSKGDQTEVEGYDSTALMKVFHTVEDMLDNLPESALSPVSATPTNGFPSQSFAGVSPMTASASAARQSYDQKVRTSTGGSSITMVNPLNASVNSIADTIDGSGPAKVEELKSASDPSLVDGAFKTVEELVNSERSYVQEIEILERYSREIQKAELISAETVYAIFSNLRQILDFQRKFLIRLETEYEPIEEGGCNAWAEGRWGRPFVDMEKEFECYGPYCANYLDAMKVVNDYNVNLMMGQALTEGDRPCLHPERELQAFMIKPVQRITKYGLLLDAVLNATAKRDYPYRAELEQGLLAVRRIAADINETTAFRQKQQTVRELVDRVDDWKGHDYEKFGDLHLDDQFTVSKADSPRDYHVFLFEKMMLCCKEITPDKKFKSGKNSNMLRKDKTVSKSGAGSKPRLALKGRIFVSNITAAVLLPPPADRESDFAFPLMPEQYAPPRVQIVWSVPAKNGDSEQDVEDSFIMSGRSEEQMKKWAEKVLDLATTARKEHSDRHERARQSNPRVSDSSRGHWGHSGFAPPTPAQDHANFFSPQTPSHPYHHLPMEGDEDDGSQVGPNGSLNGLAIYGVPGVSFPSNARRTQSQQSMPPIPQIGQLRARALTEDHDGPSMAQWRQQVPSAPPLPRITSGTSESSWTGNGYSRPPGRVDDEEEHVPHAPPGSYRYGGMSRGPSQGVSQPLPPLRNRSVSSPNVHQPPQASPVPPMPHTAATTNGTSPSWPQNGNAYGSGSTSSSSTGLGSTPGGTAYFARRMSDDKRDSRESHTTETSDTSSQSPRTPYTNATPGDLRGATPVSRQNSQETAPSATSTVLVKVRSGDANFVIPVASDVSYRTLYEKVVKKLRLCSARHTNAGLDLVVRIKWLDSDGDEVVINTDSDVQVMISEAASEQIQLIAA